MIELIGGSATSRGEWVPSAGKQPAGSTAGEVVVLLQCNRKRCARSWTLPPGVAIPSSCPSCGKFDW